MKKTLRKSLRKQKRTLENLAEMFTAIDYNKIRLQQKQYLQNLMATNQKLLRDNKIDNLIVF